MWLSEGWGGGVGCLGWVRGIGGFEVFGVSGGGWVWVVADKSGDMNKIMDEWGWLGLIKDESISNFTL